MPHKNRAVNTNAFQDDIHLQDYHDNHTSEIIDFISDGNINKHSILYNK